MDFFPPKFILSKFSNINYCPCPDAAGSVFPCYSDQYFSSKIHSIEAQQYHQCPDAAVSVVSCYSDQEYSLFLAD